MTLNTGANTAVHLSNNPTAIITFSGGMDIDASSGTGFSSSNSGTVNASGSGNTIDSPNARADIDNTLLGISLRTVNSTGGTVPGIDLAPTTGSFAVTGVAGNCSHIPA